MEPKNKPVDSVVGPGAVGPGAVQDGGERPKPLLEGSTEFEYVVLLNPLPYDFVGQVAVTRTVSAPMRVGQPRDGGGLTNTQDDVTRNYGLDLRNQDVVGRVHITNKVPIPSGQTQRMFGHEAQVILKQLVDVVMSHEGKMIAKGDPFARHEVETRLVISRGSIMDVMNEAPVSVQDQMREALAKEEEREFEGAGETTTSTPEASQETGAGNTESTEPVKRGPGRPKGSGNKAS